MANSLCLLFLLFGPMGHESFANFSFEIFVRLPYRDGKTNGMFDLFECLPFVFAAGRVGARRTNKKEISLGELQKEWVRI